jgi:hypothetical protein
VDGAFQEVSRGVGWAASWAVPVPPPPDSATVSRQLASLTAGRRWQVPWALFDRDNFGEALDAAEAHGLASSAAAVAGGGGRLPAYWRANFYRTNMEADGSQANPAGYYAWNPSVPLGASAAFHRPERFGVLQLLNSSDLALVAPPPPPPNAAVPALPRSAVSSAAAEFWRLHGCTAAEAPPADDPHLFTLDSLDCINGHPVTVVGAPALVPTPLGTGLEFNGEGDAIFLPVDPLAGHEAFTAEIYFSPHPNGRLPHPHSPTAGLRRPRPSHDRARAPGADRAAPGARRPAGAADVPRAGGRGRRGHGPPAHGGPADRRPPRRPAVPERHARLWLQGSHGR